MANWKQMIGTKVGDWEILERDYNPTSKQHSTFFLCRCGLCNKIYSVSKDSLTRGQSSCCNHCKGTKIKQSLKENGYSIIDKRIPIGTRFGFLKTISTSYYRDDRNKNKKYIRCICDCGKEIEVRVDHLEGTGDRSQTLSCGCKNISNGELKIKMLLDKNNINYIYQYRFDDFKQYAFDFAIFDSNNNLIKVIEYDGKQHFKPVLNWGGEEQFKKQQERDEKKNKYCKEHNIILQRIPYTEYNNLSIEMLI